MPTKSSSPPRDRRSPPCAQLASGRNGRWIRCRNILDDVRGSGAASNAIVRIFPNDPTIRYRGELHEFVARTGETMALPASMTSIEIVHRGYLKDVMLAGRGKAERNLRVSRAAYEANPDDPAHVYNYAASLLMAGEPVEGRWCSSSARAR